MVRRSRCRKARRFWKPPRRSTSAFRRLCHHPALKPYGGCRLCVVEVDGFRTMQASCTLPASNNMVVRTDTPALRESREFVLSMLFSERNHFCPFCQVSGGDCELQNSAYDEDMTHWPIQPNWTIFPVDTSHPYYVLDNNRCILCRRCVRACGELVGNFTLAIEERGANNMLIADVGVPLGESTCIKCGTCVQVCPTGALIDRRERVSRPRAQHGHHAVGLHRVQRGVQRQRRHARQSPRPHRRRLQRRGQRRRHVRAWPLQPDDRETRSHHAAHAQEERPTRSRSRGTKRSRRLPIG